MAIALLFPGQGSQSVGMLAALAARYGQVTETFAEASRALGFDLWELVAAGPAERLNATNSRNPPCWWRASQPGVSGRSKAVPSPAVVAGHSLGEFTALVCAQALSLQDAVQLVRYRGQIMQQAVPEGTGAMAAILGLGG
jgi:[acyl-carrier-protein] S-malonyltransferase